VAVGRNSLTANTTASENTAVGYNAGTVVTTGGANSLFGGYSGNSLSTGSSNTLVGINAGFYATGTDAVFNLTTENNRIVVGNNNATNAYVKVAWTVTSDARDKMNFNSVPHGLDFVSKLEPISFQFKKSREEEIPHGNVRYGFKAQDILALEGDNPIIIDNENPDNLKYQGEALVPVLVNAIKELKAEIDLLKN
jgi:trimeric autotransporter adhesin